MEYLFIDDAIVSRSNAQISVFDLGLLRGYGVFDFFKVHDGVPVFADDHISRFERSAGLLNLKSPYSPSKLKEIVITLIEKNNIRDGTMRLVLTGGYSSNGFSLDGQPTFLVIPAPLSFKIFTSFGQMKPYKLMSVDYVRETPEIKSLNYLIPMMHWPEVIRGNYDDVLYVHQDIISETSRANIFFITREDILVTPVQNVLLGITRKYILQLAKVRNIKIEERQISLAEALTCKEAFLSSTTKQVMPVTGIDRHWINNGETGQMTKSLFELFYDFEMNHISHQKSIQINSK